MDVKQLEYLLEIEKEGSISKAADKLFISQSALSQCLKKHEKELNKALFKRIGNRLTPTDIGELYLNGAREMIEIKNDVYDEINLLTKENQYKIAIDPQFYTFVSEIVLPNLKNIFPGFNLEIIVVDSSLSKQFIYNNIANFALMCSTTKSNHLLTDIKLCEDELVFCVPKSLDISSHKIPFIFLKTETMFRSIQQDLLSSNGLIPNKTYTVDDFISAKQMVEKQYGATYLPKKLAVNNNNFDVYSLDSPYYFNIIFTYNKFDTLNEECKTLLKLLENHLNNINI